LGSSDPLFRYRIPSQGPITIRIRPLYISKAMLSAGNGNKALYGSTNADKNVKTRSQYRELFPSLLTIALFAVFASAIVNGVRLAREPNAKYWVGEAGYAVLVIPLLVMLSHLVQSYCRRPLYLAIVASCAVPPLLTLVLGYMYFDPVNAAVARLLSTDCTTFPEKFQIEQAYKAASTFYDDCLAAEAKNKTLTVEAVRQDTVISQCPGYNPVASGFPREWSYLQALEETEHCSGWCFDGEGALWTHNPTSWDSCSSSAGMTMKNMVSRNAGRMMTNGIIGFILAAVVIFAMNEWITRTDDPSLHW